ncbi:energy-coupled thiamine transporter ThiT [Erysipelothrix tonsillarum]|uniref:energy-coupled thiamine transporter ThiT n=1 Tax=Erysipelothrix tonsillarum TaxID=38402 RepID=UPI00037B8BC6|nr:ECF transporter S component [Erysipelothrix tonsillarum]
MKTKDLVLIAMYSAVFGVLEYITVTFDILRLPQGGSVSLSVVAIILASYHLGFKKSLMVAFLSFLLKFMIKTPTVLHWFQFICDYIFAYSAYALAGLVPDLSVYDLKLPVGVVVSNGLRFIMHMISGLVFYSEFYKGNVFWGIFAYNAAYMIPTTIISFALVLALKPKLVKYF